MIAKLKKLARASIPYLAITAITLVILDVALIVTGLFPPGSDPGDPDLGWAPAEASGEMNMDVCLELVSQQVIRYQRNDDGVRSSLTGDEIRAFPGPKLGVSGDSHTDLCALNAETHYGYTESALAEAGVDATVFAFGSGRYSPLQAYLAYKRQLGPYDPDVFILNFYTGNDFNDLLRVDDRPFLEPVGEGYEVSPPRWYRLDDPEERRSSRVLYLGGQLLESTGVSNLFFRVLFLRRMAAEQGEGSFTVLAYLNDLRESVEPTVGYPEAFAAQFLNQHLFFRRFGGAKEEAMARAEAVLELVRRENPELTLVMSPIPSYLLAYGEEPDQALVRVMERLGAPLEEAVAEEDELYSWLAEASARHGWIFVDNRDALRAYEGDERLFNDYDYHIMPVASEIIGRNQSAALLEAGMAWDSVTGFSIGGGAGSR